MLRSITGSILGPVTVLSESEVAEVTQIVTAAGRHALRWFRPSRPTGESVAGAVDNKADRGFDPVTEADRAVERRIRDALAGLFPDHAITGEEFGNTGSGRYRWFIDPVDGTRAFVSGQPMWGTLLGLMVDGEPLGGWMHLPVLDETYVGVNGSSRLLFPNGGARAEAALEVGPTTALAEAIVLSTDPSMFAPGPEWDRYESLSAAVKMVRYGGDCMNYGLLASGDVDLVVENQLAPYDIIPLIPIITGAGGVVTDLDGNPPIHGGFVVAAATAELHRAAVEMLSPADP